MHYIRLYIPAVQHTFDYVHTLRRKYLKRFNNIIHNIFISTEQTYIIHRAIHNTII